MITLYYHGESPHCVRARIALALAGVKYREVAMKLDGDQHTPSFRSMSLLGTVPLLVDGRAVVGQSYAALLWLADRYPRLLPTRAARARALTWIAASATVVDPPVLRAAELAGRPGRDAGQLRDALGEVRSMLARIERAQAGTQHPYVMGRTLTVVDAALYPAFAALADLATDHPRGVQLHRVPWWKAWYARVRSRPEVRAAMAEPAR